MSPGGKRSEDRKEHRLCMRENKRVEESKKKKKRSQIKVVGAVCLEREQQREDKGDRYEWRVEMDWSCDKTVY